MGLNQSAERACISHHLLTFQTSAVGVHLFDFGTGSPDLLGAAEIQDKSWSLLPFEAGGLWHLKLAPSKVFSPLGGPRGDFCWWQRLSSAWAEPARVVEQSLQEETVDGWRQTGTVGGSA